MSKVLAQWEKRKTAIQKSKVRFAVLTALMKIVKKMEIEKKPKAKGNKRTEQIAQEIMQQLGANKFRAMVGAKDIFYLTHETKYGDSNPAIRFKIMRNAKGVNLVVIALNALDLYDMYFYKTRGANEPLLVAEENDVYADMLRKMFEKNTGLYTSL
jgi:hypothetical protein